MSNSASIGLLDVPTVLILGAGASNPYGFPLGPELKRAMMSHVAKGKTQTSLSSLGFDLKLVKKLHDALRYGSHPTVDVLLEEKPSFRELGSFLIASTLKPLESPGGLFPPKDWYAELYRNLRMEEDSKIDNLSIVTLNYDRSLEHFLRMNIEYNCPEKHMATAFSNLESINIIHAHGCLGDYPDSQYGTGGSDPESIRSAAEGIKIVSDHMGDSEDFQSAIKISEVAERVIFLGFGYNQVTLDALAGNFSGDEKKIYGTAWQLPKKDRVRVEVFFATDLELGAENEDIVAFLKRHGIFLS